MELGQPRDEMLTRMSSRELTGWMALFAVKAEEDKRRQDERESGDGDVFDPRIESDDDEGDDDED